MAYAEPPAVPETELARLNADLDKGSTNRAEAAVAMRIAGAAYSEIARTLDFTSAHQARMSVEATLAATAGGNDREQLRFVEARRLERLLRSLWRKALDENHDEHLAAIRTALAVIDRHARLYGLDAPAEMVVYSPSREEIDRFVAVAAASLTAKLPDEADIIDGQVVDG